jgi:flagellar basal body rod protein FlgC
MVMGSARLGPVSNCSANYRSVFSSERAPYTKKQVIVRFKENVISSYEPKRGAGHKDELAY